MHDLEERTPIRHCRINERVCVHSLWCGEVKDLLCAQLGDRLSGTKFHLLDVLLSRAQFLSLAIN